MEKIIKTSKTEYKIPISLILKKFKITGKRYRVDLDVDLTRRRETYFVIETKFL